MITVTIEGPQASGKSRIAHTILEYVTRFGKTCILKEEITDAALEKNKHNIDVLIIEKLAENFEEENSSKIYNKTDPWQAIGDIFQLIAKCRQRIEEIKAHNEDNPLIKELFYRIQKLEQSPAETLNDNLDKSLKDYILTEAQKLDTDLRLAALKHVEIGSTNFTDEAEKIYQWLSKGTLNGKEIKKD